MSASHGPLGSAAARVGLLLALGAALAAAQDAHRELEPADERESVRPVPQRPRLTLVPTPVPALEPGPAPAPAPVEAPLAESESGRGLRRAKRTAVAVLTVATVAVWAWFLLPQSLGGRASWVLVSGKSMLPVYKTGDLVLVRRQSRYHVGEVIAYHVPKGGPMAGLQVIHRIVGGDAVHGFVVQGDNRTAPDVWRPKPGDIVGAELLRIPYGVTVVQHLRSPLMLGLLAASFVFVYALGSRRRGDGPDSESPGEPAADSEERRAT